MSFVPKEHGSFAGSIHGSVAAGSEREALDGGAHPDLSEVGCFVHMIRGNLGPGCLSLPFAFAGAGLGLSLILSIPIVVLCLFSFNVLLWAKKEVVTQGLAPGGVRLSYSDIAVATLGPMGRCLVELAVCTTQLGVCTVYYSFVATNVNTVIPDLSAKIVIVIMMPLAFFTLLIRSPGQLTVLSTIGNVCMFAGIILVFVALAPKLSPGFTKVEKLPMFHWEKATSFASNMIFSFEGIALMIPMEFAMIKPAKFPLIMTTSMAFVACLFVIFGSYCLIGLGGVVSDGSISAAMKGQVPEVFLYAINIILAIAVLVTYPLQCYPAIEIFDVYLEQRGVARNGWGPVIMRFAVSTLCGCVALAVSDVSKLVALVGSLGSPLLGLLIPPAMHIMAKRPPLPILIMDCLCLLLGLFALFAGSYYAIKDIVDPDVAKTTAPPSLLMLE